MTLAPWFCSALGDSDLDLASLDLALTEVIARVRGGLPDIEVDARALVQHLARSVFAGPAKGDVSASTTASVLATLATLHVRDLALALACVQHQASALARFEQECMAEVDARVRKLGGDAALSADVKQILRERLLVGAREQAPKLLDYRGTGPLVGWVRVAATREALLILRRGAERFGQDEPLLDLHSDGDPELNLLKRKYQHEFKRAFNDAVAELSPRDRNLLRQQLVFKLPLEEMARLHGVHRVSVSRWLEKARRQLLTTTTRRLERELKVSATELESILALIRNSLDVTLEGLLRTRPA